MSYKYLYIDKNQNLIYPTYDTIDLYNMIEENIAPKEAENIGVFEETIHYNLIDTLDLNNNFISLKHKYKDCEYSIGLFSDIHNNEVCDSNSHDENIYNNFENALNYCENFNLDFICCLGDITSNNLSDLYFYKSRCEKTTLPVFTCKGNHDNAAIYYNDGTINNDIWLETTIPSVLPKSIDKINYFNSGDKTSFWFKKNNDIYIFFNIDYHVNSDTAIKTLNDDGKNNLFYTPESIVELQQILDENRNNRCFIFTHHPFVNKAGNVIYDYTRNIDKNYILSGKQFALLNELNNYYTNTIWFSGHTYYQWKWQSNSEKANICNWDVLNDDYNYNDYNDYAKNINNKYSEYKTNKTVNSGYCVHIPAMTGTAGPNKTYYKIGSEMAFMDVYNDGVNIKGFVFNDPSINNIANINMFSSIANYWIPIRKNNPNLLDSKTFDYFENKIKEFDK